MNKKPYIRQISGIVAALACVAASTGCRSSSTQAQQSGPKSQVAPCVADHSCPGYATTVAGQPAAPIPVLPPAAH